MIIIVYQSKAPALSRHDNIVQMRPIVVTSLLVVHTWIGYYVR